MEQNEKGKYIAIHFTLKGQEFSDIKPVLEQIAEAHPGAILIHGFMSREDLATAGITDTTIPDVFGNLFPDQRAFFKDGEVRRRDMFAFAYDNLATVYVIGRIKDGVKEEVVQYLNAGMDVIFIRLDGKTETGPVKMSHEEANSFLGLNESLISFGNYLLSAERYNNIREAHPEWDEVEVERHSNEVTDADIQNWINHPNRHSFLNNKTSNDMKTTSFQRNTDTDNGGGTGNQQDNQNLSQGTGNEGAGTTNGGEESGKEAGEGQGEGTGNTSAGAGENTGSEAKDGGANGSLDEGKGSDAGTGTQEGQGSDEQQQS